MGFIIKYDGGNYQIRWISIPSHTVKIYQIKTVNQNVVVIHTSIRSHSFCIKSTNIRMRIYKEVLHNNKLIYELKLTILNQYTILLK